MRNLRPFRVSGLLGTGFTVIELPEGALEATGTLAGDELRFEP